MVNQQSLALLLLSIQMDLVLELLGMLMEVIIMLHGVGRLVVQQSHILRERQQIEKIVEVPKLQEVFVLDDDPGREGEVNALEVE